MMSMDLLVEILKVIISGLFSLGVAFGTWHVTMKKDREKQMDEVRELINSYKSDTKEDLRNLKDDVIRVNATTQNQISIIEVKIDTLSERVDKHNSVIERTFKLEQANAVHEEQIRNLSARLSG